MSLEDKLQAELTAAVKAKDEVKVQTLRLTMAQIKNAQIEKKGALTDEEILKILKLLVKQRDEAIAAFKKGGRQELAAKELKEKKILESYLPEQMSSEEIEKVVDQILSESGTTNFGQIMGEVMKKLGGQADGKTVSQVVAKKLKANSS